MCESSEEVVAWVRETIAMDCGQEISDEILLARLDICGLNIQTILMEAEEHFDIEFVELNASNFNIGAFKKVGDVVAFIRRSMRKQEQAA